MTENTKQQYSAFHFLAITILAIIGIVCGMAFQHSVHKKALIPLHDADLQIAQAYCNNEIESFNPLEKLYICKGGKLIYIDDAKKIMAQAKQNGHTSGLEYLKLLANPQLAKPSKTPEQEYAEKFAERTKTVAFLERACKDHLGFKHRRMTSQFALCQDGYYVAHNGGELHQDMIEDNLKIDMDIAKGIKQEAVYD